VATIEPFSAVSNPTLNTETTINEYIVINDDIAGTSVNATTTTIAAIQENVDEIVLIDDEEPNGDSSGSESGYVDVHVQQTRQNLQQNILSSTVGSETTAQNSTEQIQYQDLTTDQDAIVEENDEQDNLESNGADEDSNQILNEEEEQEEEVDNEEEEEDQEEVDNDDDNADNDENSQSNQVNDAEDLHLEMQHDEQDEPSERPEGETNEDSGNNYGDGSGNQTSGGHADQNEECQGQPDSSAQQTNRELQQQQQQSIQSSTLRSESPSSTSQQQLLSQQQKTGLFANLSSNARPVFGTSNATISNQTEQRKEALKPIVWDGTATTSTLFQTGGTSGAGGGPGGSNSNAGNYRIRRTPLIQTTSANPSQQQQGFMQAEQQQTPGFQPNQFRMQNSRFQFQSSNNQSNDGPQSLMAQQTTQPSVQGLNQPIRLMPRGPRMPNTQQQQQQQQVPGRIRPTSSMRGGLSRGANAASGAGAAAAPPGSQATTGGTRGARNNF
jgi:hypothetical protein